MDNQKKKYKKSFAESLLSFFAGAIVLVGLAIAAILAMSNNLDIAIIVIAVSIFFALILGAFSEILEVLNKIYYEINGKSEKNR